MLKTLILTFAVTSVDLHLCHFFKATHHALKQLQQYQLNEKYVGKARRKFANNIVSNTIASMVPIELCQTEKLTVNVIGVTVTVNLTAYFVFAYICFIGEHKSQSNP